MRLYVLLLAALIVAGVGLVPAPARAQSAPTVLPVPRPAPVEPPPQVPTLDPPPDLTGLENRTV
ncbi:MAG TPA: hypothetical protein VK762_21815, partial [Polyangiaceae bacterium]|nr:hypothetical protein [Polyangiaceae bacterium]